MEVKVIDESTEYINVGLKPVVDVDLAWFEREALKELFLDTKTTLDINVAKIGRAYERISQYIELSVSCNVDFLVSIQYSGYPWQPYNGSAELSNVLALVMTDGDDDELTVLRQLHMEEVLGNIRAENRQDAFCDMSELGVEPIELNQDIIKSSLDPIRNTLCAGSYLYKYRKMQISKFCPLREYIPGDNHKDIRPTLKNAHFDVIKRIASKEYVLPIEYKGEKYEMVLFTGDKDKTIERIKIPNFDMDRFGGKKGVYKMTDLEDFRSAWWR